MLSAAAGALAAANGAGAAATNGASIRVPDAIPAALDLPAKAAAFPMRGAQVFARACKQEGLAALFCCPGNYDIINSLAEEGVPCYGGRTEGAMCAAADGFIRVTGEVAACSGTEGPGFTNMIMNIAAANAARSPLLVLASNKRIADEDAEMGIQTVYQQPTTEGMKKYGKRLIDPKRVHEYAAYAFRQLKTGVPRPVHLDFPAEVAAARFKDSTDLRYYYDNRNIGPMPSRIRIRS